MRKYKKIPIQNTQIQHLMKCPKDPSCGIFLKRGLFKDVKNDIPMCQKRKYKNTSTQIHKHTNTQIQHMITKHSGKQSNGLPGIIFYFHDGKGSQRHSHSLFLHRIDGIS